MTIKIVNKEGYDIKKAKLLVIDDSNSEFEYFEMLYRTNDKYFIRSIWCEDEVISGITAEQAYHWCLIHHVKGVKIEDFVKQKKNEVRKIIALVYPKWPDGKETVIFVDAFVPKHSKERKKIILMYPGNDS